jgi:hypothetical protein
MSTGLNPESLARPRARTESYLQSLVPYPISPLGPQNPVDLRFNPRESKDVVLNLDPTAIFRQVYYRFQLKNEYAGPALTGVLTWGAEAIGTLLYTGVGTAFLGQLAPGYTIWYVAGNVLRYATVDKVLTNTTFLAVQPIEAAATAEPFGKMLGRNIPAASGAAQKLDWIADTIVNTGTVSLTTVSSTMTGVGTLFTTQLVVGDKIQVFGDDGREQYLIVDSITNNTTATIKGFPSAAITAKAFSRFYTRYSDLEFQVYNSAGLSFGKPVIVQASQGAFGSVDLFQGKDGLIHRPYFLGRSEAIILKITNRSYDARLVHGHVGGVRVLT